jgi:D-lactate dehydrogenase (cytochrome)
MSARDPELAPTFAAIVGEDAVATSPSELLRHGSDESYHQPALPDIVVYPHSTDEVVRVVAECRRLSLPIVPFGAGTSLEGHVTAVLGGISLDMTRMNRIVEVRIPDLDVTVEPGVTRLQLDAALRPEGVFFPVDPGADSTVGGMISTGASGTTTVRYGTMRENVVSLTVVLADGAVVRTRSRARKSSAGYDLTQLFVGAEGTLGVITEAVLRLHPTPEAMTAAVCSFPSVRRAVECVIATIQMGIGVARAELLDEVQMGAVIRRHQLAYSEAPTLFFELHGSRSAVEEQEDELRSLAETFGARDFVRATDERERRRLWEARHRAYEAALAMRPGARGLLTDVCVPLSRLAECVEATRHDIDASGLTAPIVGHAGDGNFHVILVIDPNRPDELDRAKHLSERLVRRAVEMDGTSTGEHGVGIGKRSFLELEHGPAAVELMRSIKRSFDPDNRFNPGKILPDQASADPAYTRAG